MKRGAREGELRIAILMGRLTVAHLGVTRFTFPRCR